MRYRKILYTILSALVITTSSGITTFAKDINNDVKATKEVDGYSKRSLLFNDGWTFNLGDVQGAKNKDFNDEDWRKLNLPHDWSIELDFNKNSPSTHEGGYLDGGIGWYRKTCTFPSSINGKRISIDFDGVYMDSYVYVNGVEVGNNPYGYTPFSFDISDKLICDGVTKNVIAVKVNNKQPSSRWYSGSGIYRDVNITVTDKVHVDKNGTFITTPNLQSEYSQGKATVNIKTDVVNDESKDKEVKVKSTIYDINGKSKGEKTSIETISKRSKKKFNNDIEIENPTLWSTNNPYIYKLNTTVIIDDKVVDEYETDFGVRWLQFTSDNGFLLNGEKIKLQGVCMHHDQGALGAIAKEASIERQVKTLKEMGVNSIRVTHNPAAKQLIDICNREGILLVEEAFDTWYGGKKTYDYGRFFEKKSIHGDMTWAEYDIKQMVDRDKNAPSVIMWSIGNEIWESNQSKAVQTAQNLNNWIKEVDPTRPTTFGEDKFRVGNGSGNHENVAKVVDVVGFNYAEDNYDKFHSKYPNWNLYGSETSSATRSRGIYDHPERLLQMHTHPDKQQSSYDNDYVGWGKTAEESWKRDRDRGYVAGQYIWTGFDYIGEPTPYYGSFPSKSSYFGAIDTAGFEKDIFYFYQSQWSNKPMVHLLPHWSFENDNSIKVDGDKILVYAYTNANSVDLYYNEDVNSKELGKLVGTDIYDVTNAGYNRKYKETKEGKLHLEFKVPYKKGKLTAIAKNEKGEEIARDVVKTANKAKKINLNADRQVIAAGGNDLSFITVEIVDENGTLVPNADNLINFEISGNGKIVGVDNGNAASVERYKDNKRKSFNGKALVIVQSTENNGSFTLTAKSDGLSSNNTAIYTVAKEDINKKEIVGYDVSDITVPINGELILPNKVNALYSDGNKGEVDVKWEEVSKEKLATVGTFKVIGKTNKSNKPVVINVVVRDIIGILDSRMLVAVGEIPELPKKVSLVYNDGTLEYRSVKWERGLTEEDVKEAKTIEIKGEVEGTSSLKAKLIVVVSRNYKVKNIALNNGGSYPRAFTTYEGPDNINNINDGIISKANLPNNRWTNWGKPGANYDEYVGIEFDREYTINKVGISLYKDGGVEIPSEILIEYFDGEKWIAVSNQSKTKTFSVQGNEEISFNTIKTNKIRALLRGNKEFNKAVGVTEFEVYSNVIQMEGTALLKDIKVNDVSVDNFNENTLEYVVNIPYGEKLPTVIGMEKDNGSVFVIPTLNKNGVTKILVTAEDGRTIKTYLVKFKEQDPVLESIKISLEKENVIEDDVIPIILDAKLQDGSKIDFSKLDIKYSVNSENGGEAKIIDNKLYAYKEGEISVYAYITYNGVTKNIEPLNIKIEKYKGEKTITSYEQVTVETEKGVIPKLPEKIKAIYDVGLSRDVKVTWEEVKAERYKEYGVFNVKGNVEGQALKAEAKVIVRGISSVGNISIATNIGVKPSLPEVVKVYYTDGSSKEMAVTWENYNKNLLNKEGAFVVSGTVSGIDINSKANIRVTQKSIKGDNIARARNGYDLPMAIASYTNDTIVDQASEDRITKVNDDVIQHNPNEANNRWSNWKRTNKNSSDWVGVIFGSGEPEQKYINNLNVDFFEDEGAKVPKNVKIQYYIGEKISIPKNPAHVANEEASQLNDDNNWADVNNLKASLQEISGTETNKYKFDMVKTYALRIKMESKPNMALAITEIKAFEEKVVLNSDFNVKSIKVNGENLKSFETNKFNYTININKNENLPKIEVDVTNNASVSTIYTVNPNENIEVFIKSEDGIKETRYSISLER
ncbi:hypothetical protein JCM1393_03810 [Clostridium carnis]